MYAVIKPAAKQYRVCAGQKLKVERYRQKLAQKSPRPDPMVGEGIREDRRPLRWRHRQIFTVVSHGRHDKINIFKDAPASTTRSIRAIVQNQFRTAHRHDRRPEVTKGASKWHTQEGRRQFTATAAIQSRSGSVKRYGGLFVSWQHHRSPARHRIPSGRQRRLRQGSHPVRARDGVVRFAVRALVESPHRDHRSGRQLKSWQWRKPKAYPPDGSFLISEAAG